MTQDQQVPAPLFPFASIVAFLTVGTGVGFALSHVSRLANLARISASEGPATSQLVFSIPTSVNGTDAAHGVGGVIIATMIYGIGGLFPRSRMTIGKYGMYAVGALWLLSEYLAQKYWVLAIWIPFRFVSGRVARLWFRRLLRNETPSQSQVSATVENFERASLCVGAVCFAAILCCFNTLFNFPASRRVFIGTDASPRHVLRADSEGMLLRDDNRRVTWIPIKAMTEVRAVP